MPTFDLGFPHALTSYPATPSHNRLYSFSPVPVVDSVSWVLSCGFSLVGSLLWILFRMLGKFARIGGAMGGVGRVPCLCVVVALVVLGLAGGAQAVQFEVTGKTTKCISEEIQSHVVVVGDYKVVHSDEAVKIAVKVTSPYGNQLHHQENVHSGQFAFTTSEPGIFMACFWLVNAPHTATLSVALDWKTGVAAKDWASIAKKEKLDGMEIELRKLEESVEAIHSEMLFLREREAQMRNLNELTNSRVAWFGILSILLCLGVAGWQLWHLKTFFERKKLL